MTDPSPSFDALPDQSAAVPSFDAMPSQGQQSFGQKLEQTWPVQLAERVYRSLTLPGDVATGKTAIQPTTPGMWSDEDEARLQATNAAITGRAKDLAQLVTPVSPAARIGVGFAGVPQSPSVTPRFPQSPSVDQLYAAANGDYAVARAMGVQIKPQSVANFAQRFQGELENDGFRDYLAPKTFSALNEMQNVPDGNAFANLADIDGMRRVLGRAAGDFTNPTEQEAASRAIGALDKYVGSVPSADVVSGDAQAVQRVLDSARGNYAAAKRAELIESQEEKAQRQAGVSGSGANINNALRQRMNQIINNKKLQRGFSDDEVDQMRQIAMGTPSGNLARKIGKLAPTGVVSSIPFLGAVAMGEPVTAATIGTIGHVGKALGERSTERGIESLSEAVRARSPLAQQLKAISDVTPAGPPSLAAQAPLRFLRPGMPGMAAIQSPQAAYGGDEQQNVERPPSQQHHGGAVERARGGKVAKHHAAKLADKTTKAQAHYRGGSTKEHCSICTMFVPPHGCSAVRGRISPWALCDLYEHKSTRAQGGAVDKPFHPHDIGARLAKDGHYYLADPKRPGKYLRVIRRARPAA